ncbi:MAG TPA: exodeoxyribonuclease III [Polyangia bacterium]
MRIATWNVNSLAARLEKVTWWLERAQPDVLLMQETKLADADVPRDAFARLGYEVAHHGVGRWNGVAIASRRGVTEVLTNFGLALAAPTSGSGAAEDGAATSPDQAPDDQPLREPRMIAAFCGNVRVVSLYAPNGRSVDSIFYKAKLAWFRRLHQWLVETRKPDEALVLGGDFNVAPEDPDVWDPARCHGGTHVSPPEREAFAALLGWGLVDGYRRLHPEPERYSWWDYRAGMFHKNYGMRIDHLLVTAPIAQRLVGADIDREARKGKPIPSDHAPVLVDLDIPGRPIDAGWEGATARIAARRGR